MVIIDTSAWIDFFLRDGKIEVKIAVKGLLDAFEGALCGPVEMEFLGGARPSKMEAIRSWFNIIPTSPTIRKSDVKSRPTFPR